MSRGAAPPSWETGVAELFSSPFWVDEAKRAGVASEWLGCMSGYALDLSDFDTVRVAAVTIYDHLASRSMPLTADVTQFWPPAALETLQAWIDADCPRGSHDAGTPSGPPRPSAPRRRLRIRRNILDLTEAELAEYRAALERLGATSSDADSVWQQVAYIHTDWCLHYQEAFLLWHRANLLYFEGMLGMPIPYWNFMSPEATVDGSPEAGLPGPFRDKTYVHPETGEVRPNPLRFAAAKDGRSKACAGAATSGVSAPECRYVQRDPVLYTSGEDRREERVAKLALIGHFQHQVAFALQWPVFSSPEGSPGYPWANIPTFDPPPPDSDYPHRTDFDGLYEQPHDNFHGWVGPDMADNAYTAFDPVFWSYHANVDRVFEDWNRAHPASSFTANFPLRPFTGPRARRADLTGPDAWAYTTIGDMARDTRALGYDYESPAAPDSRGAPPVAAPAGAVAPERLYILFPGVSCIHETYVLDVFVDLLDPAPSDTAGAHYVGRMTRLGMGVEDDKGRCVARGVTRVMDATHNASALGLVAGSPVTPSLVVTHLASGKVLTPDERQELPGFAPVARWGEPMPATAVPGSERTTPCH